MAFQVFTNAVTSASKGFAKGLFIFALLLVGFGVLILKFPEVFAFMAALIFFIAGLGCASTALKIYLAHRRFTKMTSSGEDQYRENVRIHGSPKDEDLYNI